MKNKILYLVKLMGVSTLSIAIALSVAFYPDFTEKTNAEDAPPVIDLGDDFFGDGFDEDAPPTLGNPVTGDPASGDDSPPSLGDPTAGDDDDAPPSLTLPGGNDPSNPGPSTPAPSGLTGPEIVYSYAYPQTIVPLDPAEAQQTTVSFKLSEDSVVEIVIVDESELVEMVTLADDVEVNGNQDYGINWDGTDNPDLGGIVLEEGKYYYKLIVKDPDTLVASDEETGAIFIGQVADPIEGDPTKPGTTPLSVIPNNNPPGQTSDTGPEALVYLLFPVAGYFAARKRK
jgi:hypothetical protein